MLRVSCVYVLYGWEVSVNAAFPLGFTSLILRSVISTFHTKFVLVPADKAANNIIIVWRLHYVGILNTEINSTKTYVSVQSSEEDLVSQHISKCSKFKLRVEDTQRKLPVICWIPKLHKPDFLLILVHAPLLLFQYSWHHALPLLKSTWENTATRRIKNLALIYFGLSKILETFWIQFRLETQFPL